MVTVSSRTTQATWTCPQTTHCESLHSSVMHRKIADERSPLRVVALTSWVGQFRQQIHSNLSDISRQHYHHERCITTIPIFINFWGPGPSSLSHSVNHGDHHPHGMSHGLLVGNAEMLPARRYTTYGGLKFEAACLILSGSKDNSKHYICMYIYIHIDIYIYINVMIIFPVFVQILNLPR